MKLYKEDYTMTQALIEKITTLCRKKGVSVNQMALEAGVNKSFVDNLKKGSFPSADKLLLVARYFGVSVDHLLSNDTPTPAPASTVITFTPEEQRVILRYRAVSEEARLIIRKILDIPNGDEELVPVYHAAHSKDGTAEDRIIYRTRAELDALENAPESDVDI